MVCIKIKNREYTKLFEIDFDGYAMGGLAVGEKQSEMFKI